MDGARELCKASCDALFGCNSVVYVLSSQTCVFGSQPEWQEDACAAVDASLGMVSYWKPLPPCEDEDAECAEEATVEGCVRDAVHIARRCRRSCGACEGATVRERQLPWSWLASGRCTAGVVLEECRAVAAQIGAPSFSEVAAGCAEQMRCSQDADSGIVRYEPDSAEHPCSARQRCICRDEELPFDPWSSMVSYVDAGTCGPRGDNASADTSGCKEGAVVVREAQSLTGSPVATIAGCPYLAYLVYGCLRPGGLQVQVPPAAPGSAPSGSAEPGGETQVPESAATTTTAASTSVQRFVQGQVVVRVSHPRAFVRDAAVKLAFLQAVAAKAGLPAADIMVWLQLSGEEPHGLRRRLAVVAEDRADVVITFEAKVAATSLEQANSLAEQELTALAGVDVTGQMTCIVEAVASEVSTAGYAPLVVSAVLPRVAGASIMPAAAESLASLAAAAIPAATAAAARATAPPASSRSTIPTFAPSRIVPSVADPLPSAPSATEASAAGASGTARAAGLPRPLLISMAVGVAVVAVGAVLLWLWYTSRAAAPAAGEAAEGAEGGEEARAVKESLLREADPSATHEQVAGGWQDSIAACMERVRQLVLGAAGVPYHKAQEGEDSDEERQRHRHKASCWPEDVSAAGMKPAAPGDVEALPAPRRAAVAAHQGVISDGTVCVAKASGQIFESATSWTAISELAVGQQVVAAGPPQLIEGYSMVPVRPHGAVDLSLLEVGVVYHSEASASHASKSTLPSPAKSPSKGRSRMPGFFGSSGSASSLGSGPPGVASESSHGSRPAGASPAPSPGPSLRAQEPQLSESQHQELASLVDMGFPRDQALHALQSSQWNTAQAMEALFAGGGGASASGGPPAASPSHAVSGERLAPQQEAAVQTLCDMGFGRDVVIAALKGADWDTDRATNHLLAG